MAFEMLSRQYRRMQPTTYKCDLDKVNKIKTGYNDRYFYYLFLMRFVLDTFQIDPICQRNLK